MAIFSLLPASVRRALNNFASASMRAIVRRRREIAILLTALVVCLFAVPNFVPEKTVQSWPKWAQRHVVLGLDLQGGSHILLEVDAADVRRQKLESLRDDIRRVLREARITLVGAPVIRGTTVDVRVREPDVAAALPKLRELAQPLGGFLGSTGARSLEVVNSGGGLIQLTVTEPALIERTRQVVEQSIEIIEKRVNQLGLVEPSIQRQGIDRILVQVPGLGDPQKLIELIGTTAKLTFRLVDLSMTAEQAQQGRPPPESELVKGSKADGVPFYLLEKRIIVTGEELTDAKPDFDQRSNEPIVKFTFNASGALPAKLTVIEQRVVGAGLGQDSIEKGRRASYFGAALVVVFMVVTYGLFGVFASIAVGINVGMIFGILSLLNATLTLPGIIGVVLTIGIAVDSNVLIYERIREEVRIREREVATRARGRAADIPVNAIKAGFDRALATILDSNITTFIAAAVLFFIGTGPVRGFAVTLGIGIVTTVFTAFTLTRLMVERWERTARPKQLAIS
jgi:preprotein translocase subunit SecD